MFWIVCYRQRCNFFSGGGSSVGSYKRMGCGDDLDYHCSFSPYYNYGKNSFSSRSSTPEPNRLAMQSSERYRTSPRVSDVSCKQPLLISTTERKSKVYIGPRSKQIGKG